MMVRGKTLLVVICTVAAVSVAADWPQLGPVVLPSIHLHPDRCTQPRTLQEAHDVLAQMLDPGLIEQMRSGSEQDVMTFNSSIGAGLRNLWGLWNGGPLRAHFRRLGLSHPDDMSEVIFVTFWRHLHNQALRVEEEVARLQAANAAGAWKPDPQCQCSVLNQCRRVVLTDSRLGRDRALEISGCCCLQIPQIVEGRPFVLPEPAFVMVDPAAWRFRETSCAAGFGFSR